ncbi:S41 family peptidase [Elioraea sp.]|uniref:S41 family peptidase n=1 Tax=Elioraea sp. TaxID=2185103 RepID=UPI003F70D1AD
MGGLRCLGLGLLAVLAVLGRAQAAVADSQAPLATVLRVGLTALAERHVDPIDLPGLTVAGLRGLSLADRRIVPRLAGRTIELRAGDGVVARVQAPPADAPASWAEAASRLITAASTASPVLARKSSAALARAFFDEALATLDPYSRYVPPEEARTGRSRRLGEAGLGLVLAPDPGGAVIARVIDDAPAWAAGLTEGERVLAIDGRSTARLSATQLEAALEGEESAPVSLTVRRESGRTETIVLARAMVAPETVSLSWQSAIPIVRVSAFNRLTDRRLARAVIAVAHRDPAPPGLVLDLRGNRGGLLRQAITAADLFLTGGVIAVAEGRHPDASRVHRADGADIAGGLRLAVLVDGASASSAEVLAAALQDNGRAVVIGSVTTGKGLIQTVVPLPDESELHITWSNLIAPGGYAVQGLGVLPAVCTSRGAEAARAALVALAAGAAREAEAAWRATAGRPVPPAEAARLRDTCPAAEGSALDITAAVWLFRGPDESASVPAPAPTRP